MGYKSDGVEGRKTRVEGRESRAKDFTAQRQLRPTVLEGGRALLATACVVPFQESTDVNTLECVPPAGLLFRSKPPKLNFTIGEES